MQKSWPNEQLFFCVIHQDVRDYLSVTVNPTNGLASQHLSEELKRNGVSGDGLTISDNHHFCSGYKGNYMQINSFINYPKESDMYIHDEDDTDPRRLLHLENERPYF